MGAIHRFEHIAIDVPFVHPVAQLTTTGSLHGELLHQVAIDHGWELGLLVVREMAAGPIQAEFADVGRVDLIVPLTSQLLGDECLELRPITDPRGVQSTRPCPTSGSMWKRSRSLPTLR